MNVTIKNVGTSFDFNAFILSSNYILNVLKPKKPNLIFVSCVYLNNI